MYVVNLSNPGVSTKVHPAMVPGGEIYYDTSTFENETIVDPIVVSPDGTKVIYAADLETDEKVELYMTDLNNLGTATKLNSTLVSGGAVTIAYQFMDNSSGVIFVADQDTDGTNELYHKCQSKEG